MKRSDLIYAIISVFFVFFATLATYLANSARDTAYDAYYEAEQLEDRISSLEYRLD